MSETTPEATERVRPELTGWKKALLACAGVFLVIGGALRLLGGGGDTAPDDHEVVVEAEPPTPEQDPAVGEGEGVSKIPKTGLVDGQGTPIGVGTPQIGEGVPGLPPGTVGVPVPQEEEPVVQAEPGAAGWSPFFLKGGFSFFVAFCVGYATRVWLKMAAFFLGTFFLGVFVLSYVGAVDVDWVTLEGWWDAFAGRVEAEAVDFKTFLTGSLPQAGLAGLGLVAGFKRK